MVTYSPFFPLSINTTYKGSESEFSLKISDQFVVDMSAWVTNPIGRLENCEMGDSNECSYLIKFILNGIGVHSASVKYKDREASGSRYECTAGSIEGDGTHKIGASCSDRIHEEVKSTSTKKQGKSKKFSLSFLIYT
ncbi:unnamed protein product [Rotaria sp. Silwood1]|nr:unnamed protein product [Rotaria sp. Silwood1]